MKYLSFLCVLIVFPFMLLSAQEVELDCHYGIQFEVSDNPSWGYGELVVNQVEPNSKAEKLGVKKGDIIMEINGKATYLRDGESILKWLLDATSPQVELSIRNVDSYFKKVTLDRQCVPKNSIDEKGLANIYSFYSLEDMSVRSFVLPIEVDSNTAADYSDYHTFDFAASKDISQLDMLLQTKIEIELINRGLTRDRKDPDMVVQTYYDMTPSLGSVTTRKQNASQEWRYDANQKKMVALSVISPTLANEMSVLPDLVSFGVSFYDRKHISKDKLTQIWDAKVKDYSYSTLVFEDYIKMHLPLLLMQYPYSTSSKEILYTVSFDKYNYTGIHFNTNDLAVVSAVDTNSPAALAGIKAGDVIRKVNGKVFTSDKELLSSTYKRFLDETMKYRDASTQYINAEGYSNCMLWNTKQYPQIAQAFDNKAYLAQFAYLFSFADYIGGKTANVITIELWDGFKNQEVVVNPIIKESIGIEAY